MFQPRFNVITSFLSLELILYVGDNFMFRSHLQVLVSFFVSASFSCFCGHNRKMKVLHKMSPNMKTRQSLANETET